MRLRQRHANHAFSARHAQRHGGWLGHLDLLVDHRAAARGLGAADVQYQLGDAFDMLDRQAGVHTALEAVAGVGGKVVAARTAGHGFGPPEGGLHIDVLGVVGHGGSVAAHDAGQRFHRLGIGNHADLVVQLDGVAVQQLELFARPAPTHFQSTVDLVQIEDVGRSTVFEHHVVRDVDQGADAALAATGQAVHHP